MKSNVKSSTLYLCILAKFEYFSVHASLLLELEQDNNSTVPPEIIDFQHFDELSNTTTATPHWTSKPTSGHVNNAHKLVHQILTFV